MENSKGEAENDEQPLELKPLLSLAPMFPTPMGYDVATQSTDPHHSGPSPLKNGLNQLQLHLLGPYHCHRLL